MKPGYQAKQAYMDQASFSRPVMPEPSYRVDVLSPDASDTAVVMVDIAHNRIVNYLAEVTGQRLLILTASQNGPFQRQVLVHVARAVMRQNVRLNRLDVERVAQVVTTHLSLESRYFATEDASKTVYSGTVVMFDRVYPLHNEGNRQVLIYREGRIQACQLGVREWMTLQPNDMLLLSPTILNESSSLTPQYLSRWNRRLSAAGIAGRNPKALPALQEVTHPLVAIKLLTPPVFQLAQPTLWSDFRLLARDKQILLVFIFSWIMALTFSILLR